MNSSKGSCSNSLLRLRTYGVKNVANQGLGKTLFREYKALANSIHKSFVKGFYSGYGLDIDEYDSNMEASLFDYEETMRSNDAPNIDLWRDRAQEHVDDLRKKLEKQFPGAFREPEFVEDSSKFDDIDPTDDNDNDQDRGDDSQVQTEYIELEGITYPILNSDDISYFKSLGYVRRKTEIPTEDELANYVRGVPYIVGIEPIYRNGVFEGFVVWIEYN